MRTVCIETLRELILYDPDTGYCYWRHRPLTYFNSKRDRNWWNNMYAGKKIGHLSKNGYLRCSLMGSWYLVHRLVWYLNFGITEKDIDHINHDRCDNRISNLRLVNDSTNQKNRKLNENNSSGHSGISWVEKRQKWQVQIQHNGKNEWGGYFSNYEDAVNKVKEMYRVYNFHDNHGVQNA